MSVRLRPRFRLRVDLDADAVMEVFTARKEVGDLPCRLHLYEHQVEFSMLKRDQHFWSPFLNLIVESDEGETCLRGKYGPNVNLWTMFMAVYAVLFVSGSVSLVMAYSQMIIGEETSGFTITAACATFAGAVYVTGQLGRYLAHPQMLIFHNFVESLFAGHIVKFEDEEADERP